MHVGELPGKHHVASRAPDGALLWEECLTRQGFDGPYTILHHRHRPHAQRSASGVPGVPGAPDVRHGWNAPPAALSGPYAAPQPPPPLRKRHYRTGDLPARALPPVDARVPLLWNDDVVVST